MREGKCTAVILAAGSGSRMKSSVAKQFLELAGKPLIYYALSTVEESKVIDDCILVTGEEDLEKMRTEIVEKYGFRKVKAVIPGGSERCFSVAKAMRWLAEQDRNAVPVPGFVPQKQEKSCRPGKSYIFIHDGARPLLTEEILERTYQAVLEHDACVAAMPCKDTVKLVDWEGFAQATPDRRTVWTVQTPQVFERSLIIEAYARFEAAGNSVSNTDGKDKKETERVSESATVTDDAGVVEKFTDVRVKLVEGAYSNIKVTTPEDMVIAEALMKAGRTDG